MNYSFEYIDIILLAMIAGFIFLRLEEYWAKEQDLKVKHLQFQEILNKAKTNKKTETKQNFDENAQKEFLKEQNCL